LKAAMNGTRLFTALFLLMVHLVHPAAIPQPLRSLPGDIDLRQKAKVFVVTNHCYEIGEPFRPYVEICGTCDDCKEGYRLSPKTCVCHKLFRFNKADVIDPRVISILETLNASL
ncbi:unnamed protein product, partial [Meganyctiphanes norvegica]